MGEKHDSFEGLLAACAAGGPSLRELLERQAGMDEAAWHRTSDTAQVAANFLRCHPSVAGVRYPGLTSDPDYREASSILRGGFGPWVHVRLRGGSGWLRFDAARLNVADDREAVLALEKALI